MKGIRTKALICLVVAFEGLVLRPMVATAQHQGGGVVDVQTDPWPFPTINTRHNSEKWSEVFGVERPLPREWNELLQILQEGREFSSLYEVREYFERHPLMERVPKYVRSRLINLAMDAMVDYVIIEDAYEGRIAQYSGKSVEEIRPQLRMYAAKTLKGNPLALETVDTILEAELGWFQQIRILAAEQGMPAIWVEGGPKGFFPQARDSKKFKSFVLEMLSHREMQYKEQVRTLRRVVATRGDYKTQWRPGHGVTGEVFRFMLAFAVAEITWALLSGDPLVLRGLVKSLAMPETWWGMALFSLVAGTTARLFYKRMAWAGRFRGTAAGLPSLALGMLAMEFGVHFYHNLRWADYMSTYVADAKTDDESVLTENVKKRAALREQFFYAFQGEAWLQRGVHFIGLTAAMGTVAMGGLGLSLTKKRLTGAAASAVARSSKAVPVKLSQLGVSRAATKVTEKAGLYFVKATFPTLWRLGGAAATMPALRVVMGLKTGVVTLAFFLLAARFWSSTISPNIAVIRAQSHIKDATNDLANAITNFATDPVIIRRMWAALRKALEEDGKFPTQILRDPDPKAPGEYLRSALKKTHTAYMEYNAVIAEPLVQAHLHWRMEQIDLIRQRGLLEGSLLWYADGGPVDDPFLQYTHGQYGIEGYQQQKGLFLQNFPIFLGKDVLDRDPKKFREVVALDNFDGQGNLTMLPPHVVHGALQAKWKNFLGELYPADESFKFPYHQKVSSYLAETKPRYDEGMEGLRNEAHWDLASKAQKVFFGDRWAPGTYGRRNREDFTGGKPGWWSRNIADPVHNAVDVVSTFWHRHVSLATATKGTSLRTSFLQEMWDLENVLYEIAPFQQLGDRFDDVREAAADLDFFEAHMRLTQLVEATGKGFEPSVLLEDMVIPEIEPTDVEFMRWANPQQREAIAIFSEHFRKILAPLVLQTEYKQTEERTKQAYAYLFFGIPKDSKQTRDALEESGASLEEAVDMSTWSLPRVED